MKTAIITGVNGQDGSYLSELLLEKGYRVIGVTRRASGDHHLYRLGPPYSNVLGHDNFEVVQGEITDISCIFSLLKEHQPDEVYNLAAMSHVGTSFKMPAYSLDCDGVAVLNFLEAIRQTKPDTKFYQASTSELFGSNFTTKRHPSFLDGTNFKKEVGKYQDEDTALSPNSPYGIGKLVGHHSVRLYREAYGLFACSNLVFNHSSPRRSVQFVLKKITSWLGSHVKKVNGKFCPTYKDRADRLHLGNLDAVRDWTHAKDVVYGMWLTMQSDKPSDYVISSGQGYSIRECLWKAFGLFDCDFWPYITLDPKLLRPREVEFLRGDSSRIRTELGWSPNYSFDELVKEMVDFDMRLHNKE